MSKWAVRIVYFDKTKIDETLCETYFDACRAYDEVEKNPNLTAETAVGRVKLQSANGTTLKMAFVA
jgi:hypothetical protein